MLHLGAETYIWILFILKLYVNFSLVKDATKDEAKFEENPLDFPRIMHDSFFGGNDNPSFEEVYKKYMRGIAFEHIDKSDESCITLQRYFE